MSTIEIHPPVFPIMQIKQSGNYISHSGYFYYKIRRISDNAIVYSCLANSQPYGANNHPGGSYIQLEPGMYEWEVHNLSKSRAILQAFIMRSDSNNQQDGVVHSGGSNNPQNAVCYGQVFGGKRTMLYFEVKEYDPGGTQWYHVNASYWFINGTGDAYTLDAPNDTVGYYTTDICSISISDGNLIWDNPEIFGGVALIPNTAKISTTAGDVDNPFYIGNPPVDPPVPPEVVDGKILLDAYNLFSTIVNGNTRAELFNRNPFVACTLDSSLVKTVIDTFGEVETGKTAWKNGSLFIGRHEDLDYAGSTTGELVARHGNGDYIGLNITLGTTSNVTLANSKYGIYIKKLSATGDIRVRLRQGNTDLIDEVITDTNEHFYSPDLGVALASSYEATLMITKGNLSYNADNLVAIGFSVEMYYSANPPFDIQYRLYDKGEVEADNINLSDIELGVSEYAPDAEPEEEGEEIPPPIWFGDFQLAFPLEIDSDSFWIYIRKKGETDILGALKYPDDTV